jgi:subtilase family serine protease
MNFSRAIFKVGVISALLLLSAFAGFAASPLSSSASTSSAANLIKATPDSTFYPTTVSVTARGVSSNLCPISVGGHTKYLHCYTPMEVQAAYNFAGAYSLVGGYKNAGKGETIAIFDAFGDPHLRHDLSVFDSTFGVPAANLNILCPQGCPKFNASNADEIGWTVEISLDVEYAHAMAPAAVIDLVVAPTDVGHINPGGYDETWALQHHVGNVWSQSFGDAADCTPKAFMFASAEQTYKLAVSEGVTPVTASGDWSANNLGCSKPIASFPASSPYNLAVGGTHLNINARGTYISETAWNDFEDTFLLQQGLYAPDVTGGAPSYIYPLPTYQSGISAIPFNCSGNNSNPQDCVTSSPVHLTSRTSSDVAFVADIDGGVLVYDSFIGGWADVGGTSVGAPNWSAIIAIADQYHGSGLGLVNALLYGFEGTKAFHDVTVGSNTAYPGTGYQATTGWDPATGVGSPNVGVIVARL